jgi:hypothetical protein
MTIPVVPWQDPDQRNLKDLPPVQNPFKSLWWTSQTVSGIPQHVMGWMVANGWRVTAVSQDTTTTPPTNYYALEKPELTPEEILASLCNSYTIAANKAQDANTIRYFEVVDSWTEMLSTSHTHFMQQIDEQNTQAGVYLTDLDTYMTEVDSLIEANADAIEEEAETAKTELAAMLTKLEDLESNASTTQSSTEAALADQQGFITTFVDDFTTKLNSIGADYLAHVGNVLDLLVEAGTGYDTHSEAVDDLLTNLGSTEVARIQEQFAASLSTQLQDLIDRGLYSSTVAVDITARNTRDRDEQLQKHYDAIAREKVANKHQLYSQLQSMIQWKGNVRDSLFEQLYRIGNLYLAGYEKTLAAQNDASRTSITVRAALLGQLQDALKQVIAGKDRYATATMQHASIIAEHKHRAITEKMNTAVAKLEGWKTIADQNRQLMALQLDTRNNLLIGLYSFVERREDIAPRWSDMAQMIASLGDNSRGWIAP